MGILKPKASLGLNLAGHVGSDDQVMLQRLCKSCKCNMKELFDAIFDKETMKFLKQKVKEMKKNERLSSTRR